MSEPAGIEQELWLTDPNLRGNMIQDPLFVICPECGGFCGETEDCPSCCEFGCMPMDHGEFEYGDSPGVI